MKTATISKDPFNLNDGVIRDDKELFIVTRQTQGSSVVYTKTPNKAVAFKDHKTPYWSRHETYVLGLGMKYRHGNDNKHCYMVELKGNYQNTMGVELQTTHAGITLHDWLRMRVTFENGIAYQHPFCSIVHVLQLMSGCVAALKQFTELGIVHGDVKADNICININSWLPCKHVITQWQEAKRIALDAFRPTFIDFAFALSTSEHLQLQHPLPQPANEYYSPMMQEAIHSKDKTVQQQKIDWRSDVYSLGYMFNHILFSSEINNEFVENIKPLIAEMLNVESSTDPAIVWHEAMLDKIHQQHKKWTNGDYGKDVWRETFMSVIGISGLETPSPQPNKPQNANNSLARSKVKAYWQAVKNNQENIFEWAGRLFVWTFFVLGIAVIGNSLYQYGMKKTQATETSNTSDGIPSLPPHVPAHYATIAQQQGQQYLKIGTQGQVLADDATQWDCVYDSKTQLLWEEKTDDGGLRDKDWSYTWYNPNSKTNGGNAGIKDDSNMSKGQICGNSLNECNTKAYVDAINQQNLCGVKDWQLPAIEDLYSLIECNTGFNSVYTIPTKSGTNKQVPERCKGESFYRPTINLIFANTRSNWYWSSSLDADVSRYAWIVTFDDGYVYSASKHDNGYVRLVRSSQ